MTSPTDVCWDLDPEGDVLLTLHNPNAPFAVWDPDWYKKVPSSPSKQNGPGPQVSDAPETPVQIQTKACSETEQKLSSTPDEPIGSTSKVQFLLSSRHLSLASKYFNRLFRGPWKEASSTSPDGLRCVDAYDWDENAMLLLMRIIHGRNYQLPDMVLLEDFAKLAVLVDYYQCHEAVALWSNKCLPFIGVKSCFDRDTILAILVSQVFKEEELFYKATWEAMRECQGELPTLGLPIMATADAFNEERNNKLDWILGDLYHFLNRLRERKAGCSLQCSAITLGTLSIYLHEKGLLDPQLVYPYLGRSVESIMLTIELFSMPEGFCLNDRRCLYLFRDEIVKYTSNMNGLSLKRIEGLDK